VTRCLARGMDASTSAHSNGTARCPMQRVWGVSNPGAIDHAERAGLCDMTGQMRGDPGTEGPWGPGASAGASFGLLRTNQDPWPSCSQLISSHYTSRTTRSHGAGPLDAAGDLLANGWLRPVGVDKTPRHRVHPGSTDCVVCVYVLYPVSVSYIIGCDCAVPRLIILKFSLVNNINSCEG
jgi:hypothetical protein